MLADTTARADRWRAGGRKPRHGAAPGAGWTAAVASNTAAGWELRSGYLFDSISSSSLAPASRDISENKIFRANFQRIEKIYMLLNLEDQI